MSGLGIDDNRMWQYAESSDGLVHIDRALKGVDYVCPSCKGKMIIKDGGKRIRHFSHATNCCAHESYQHELAKKRFKQWYDESKSVTILIRRSIKCKKYDTCPWEKNLEGCTYYEMPLKIDLKSIFDQCEMEKDVLIDGKSYRPDVLLSFSRKPGVFMFVEFNVTHGCSLEKKESSARIIEFKIQSEEDIESIIGQEIVEGPNVTYFGFKTEIAGDNNDNKSVEPQIDLKKVTIYKSGKCFLKSCNCQNYEARHSSSTLELTVKEGSLKPYEHIAYVSLVAMNRDVLVKRCDFCKNKIIGFKENAKGVEGICKILNKPCRETPINCDQFVLNESFYKEWRDKYLNFTANNPVDLWIADREYN